MTQEMARLAQKHVVGFVVGEGLPDPHAEYLRTSLSPKELAIGGNLLMKDPDARRILVASYREIAKKNPAIHLNANLPDDVIAENVARQINLIRSAAIFGIYGYLED